MDRWKCPMNWSTDIPARPGWYWWRNRAKGHAPALVEVKVDEYWFLKVVHLPVSSKSALYRTLMKDGPSGQSGLHELVDHHTHGARMVREPSKAN